jgi:hypothetical protein
MISHRDETEFKRRALEISVWENEGGSPSRDSMDHHYGRRVETDGSWSVYHVFTGNPAEIGGHSMTGMSRSSATLEMVSLNQSNDERRRVRDARL